MRFATLLAAPLLCLAAEPTQLSITAPEGNYDVTVTFGSRTAATNTTLKVEGRRLVVEALQLPAGQTATRTFTVNVRRSRLKSGEQVKLKRDEIGHFDWDDKLNFEINGPNPSVTAIDVAPAPNAITVYIAGDSTVTDQGREPWAAWGQMLPRFFKQGVAIANHAESGEAMKSFIGERRLEKITDTIKAGDYLFIQFAHNDQKRGGAYLEANSTYKDYLRKYIAEARTRGAIPVLVTSMHRRTFDEAGKIANSLGDYPEAVRQVGREDHVPVIDLNAMSRIFYEALGPENSKKAFVQYPAGTFPGQAQELKDNTHFNNYGAYELARCVVEGIRAAHLGLEKYVTDDARPFDPAHPDPVVQWSLPASPFPNLTTPEGR